PTVVSGLRGRYATSTSTKSSHDAKRHPIHDVISSARCESDDSVNPSQKRLRCRDCRVFADFYPLWVQARGRCHTPDAPKARRARAAAFEEDGSWGRHEGVYFNGARLDP